MLVTIRPGTGRTGGRAKGVQSLALESGNLFRGFDDRTTHVLPAVGASDVRGNLHPAFGAWLQLFGGKAVVRPALATARIGVFSFRDGHGRGSMECCGEATKVPVYWS